MLVLGILVMKIPGRVAPLTMISIPLNAVFLKHAESGIAYSANVKVDPSSCRHGDQNCQSGGAPSGIHARAGARCRVIGSPGFPLALLWCYGTFGIWITRQESSVGLR